MPVVAVAVVVVAVALAVAVMVVVVGAVAAQSRRPLVLPLKAQALAKGQQAGQTSPRGKWKRTLPGLTQDQCSEKDTCTHLRAAQHRGCLGEAFPQGAVRSSSRRQAHLSLLRRRQLCRG